MRKDNSWLNDSFSCQQHTKSSRTFLGPLIYPMAGTLFSSIEVPEIFFCRVVLSNGDTRQLSRPLKTTLLAPVRTGGHWNAAHGWHTSPCLEKWLLRPLSLNMDIHFELCNGKVPFVLLGCSVLIRTMWNPGRETLLDVFALNHIISTCVALSSWNYITLVSYQTDVKLVKVKVSPLFNNVIWVLSKSTSLFVL